MPNNPVQVVLNTNNFIVTPEQTVGGSVKDFFAGRDEEFSTHKGRLLSELGQIGRQLNNESAAGLGYAHVVLQGDAWAKSNRPTRTVLPATKVPVIGGGHLGEMLVELTTENLPSVEAAIQKAEETVALKKKNEEWIPSPSRYRGEVGAIQTIRPHLASDRRSFSAEEAAKWLADPRTGGLYIVETFADLAEFGERNHGRDRAQAVLTRFLQQLKTTELPIELVDPPEQLRQRRLLFIRVNEHIGLNLSGRVSLHQSVLEFFDHQPAVRRILLPPIIEPGHVNHGLPRRAEKVIASPGADAYAVVGIVDTGVSDTAGLNAWCVGRVNLTASDGQDKSHGTFIAGLASAGNQLNSHEMFDEPPCKFFDLGLFPTSPDDFQAFYPRGFLDFLEQLVVELRAAKEQGVRVFNMSLALEREVSDDSYGVFASLIDAISDEEDVILVLPSGNLKGALWREEWPDDPNSALRMLAEYRHGGKDRILQPAESIRAVVTGAVNPPTCTESALRPTCYTRRGPSAALGTKPDVAHIGGRGKATHSLTSVDVNGFEIEGCGTSYAAPLVAKILANLDFRIEGSLAREALIALLVHHSVVPRDLRSNLLERVLKDFLGFGIPVGCGEMLESGDQTITLLFSGELEANRELVFPFSWPSSLVGNGGQCRGKVRMTLVYRPPVDSRFDAEFVRINLDAYLRQEKLDLKTGEVKGWEGRLKAEGDKRYERELIEHGQKWCPVKQYERDMKRVGSSSQWRLVVDGLARSGTDFPNEGVPFCVMLTIEGSEGDGDVFREMRQGLQQTSGAQIADIRTANRIRTKG